MTRARTNKDWIATWLDSVASRSKAMSQRTVSSIERHGGLDRLVEAARAQRIHLVLLTDDTGRELVAASLKPFRTLC